MPNEITKLSPNQSEDEFLRKVLNDEAKSGVSDSEIMHRVERIQDIGETYGSSIHPTYDLIDKIVDTSGNQTAQNPEGLNIGSVATGDIEVKPVDLPPPSSPEV